MGELHRSKEGTGLSDDWNQHRVTYIDDQLHYRSTDSQSSLARSTHRLWRLFNLTQSLLLNFNIPPRQLSQDLTLLRNSLTRLHVKAPFLDIRFDLHPSFTQCSQLTHLLVNSAMQASRVGSRIEVLIFGSKVVGFGPDREAVATGQRGLGVARRRGAFGYGRELS